MYTVQRSASTACEQRSTSPRRYASRSFCTARCPSLTRTSATLSSSTVLVIPRRGGAADRRLGRRSRPWRPHRAETVDLPARHGFRAPLHEDRAEIHGVDIFAELAERLTRTHDLIATRD